MKEQGRSSSACRDDIEVLVSSDVKPGKATPPVEEAVEGLDNLSLKPTITSIQDLKDSPNIWYKIHVLIFDLRSYQVSSASRDRLETVIDTSYIGLPYFTTIEAAVVKRLQIGGSKRSPTLAGVIEETLKERLERRLKKRVESEDYGVCAAHDVAPILEGVLGVEEKDMMRDKEFLGLVEKWGGELGGGVAWKGLQKKGFKPKGKK
jgi:hypothetical protein